MKLRSAVTEHDHYRGPLHAPIVLVEYGDFECPFSAKAFSEIEHALKELKGNICFAFRHFPLPNIHPHSNIGALAAEAADQQGQFWQMHHMLYQNHDTIDQQSVNFFAQVIGLDMERFQGDMQNPELLKKIERDFKFGVRSGVNGTPSLFLNGERFEGPVNQHEIVMAAEEILQSVKRPSL